MSSRDKELVANFAITRFSKNEAEFKSNFFIALTLNVKAQNQS